MACNEEYSYPQLGEVQCLSLHGMGEATRLCRESCTMMLGAKLASQAGDTTDFCFPCDVIVVRTCRAACSWQAVNFTSANLMTLCKDERLHGSPASLGLQASETDVQELRMYGQKTREGALSLWHPEYEQKNSWACM